MRRLIFGILFLISSPLSAHDQSDSAINVASSEVRTEWSKQPVSLEMLTPQGHFDWHHFGPLAFLDHLKNRTGRLLILGAPEGWIKEDDLPELMNLIDSTEPCPSVRAACSSYIGTGTSTVGNEAAFLIEGYRKGRYPPGLNSTRPRPDIREIRSWWRERTGDEFAGKLVQAAIERTSYQVIYNGSYRSIDYPGGDVPGNIGVCTDVVIRAYRTVGIDLQKAVHEDMSRDFAAYPDNWGLSRPDHNIDHRRVPNLQMFFSRNGTTLPKSNDPGDYRPGDIVTWMLPGSLPHIGIVVRQRSADGQRPLIVHNIGAGPQLEDRLFDFPITGHYRYPGQE